MKNQKTLSEKLKSYSLLASALIGSEAVANAQVIYTDLDPDVTNYGVSAYSLDLNNDGVVDFTLEGDAHHDGGVECTTSSCWGFTNNSQSVKVSPAPGNSVAIASGYPAIAGYLINSNLMWNDNSEQRLGLFSSWWVSGGGSGGGTTGYWYCADKKFLPLRFIFNGEEHYGWVRLSVACEYQSFTIHDYAYEQQPDTPIIAGCISGSILYADMDEDGYGDPGNSSFFSDCRQSGYLTDHSDCNDNNANLHPGVCDGTNGIDDNCDGVIDDGYGTTTFYADNDEDGYGSINSYVNECSTPGGYVTNSADCDDANSTIHPGVPELPNGIDDNCTGLIDDIGNAPCDGVMLSLGVNGPYDTHGATVDPDEVSPPRGTCSASGYWCNNTSSNLSNSLWFSFVAPASGNVTIQSPDFDTQLALWKVSDCADYSTYTLVDASDDEPNYAAHGGVIYSSYMGSYNCSHQLVPGETYYVQLDPWSANGSTRIVLTDAGTPVDAVVFYTDNDGDGFGDPQVSVSLCNQTSGYVSNSTDCDDANSSLNPGAEEVINCIDDNCNGIIDEGKWIQKANFGGTARYNAVGFTIGSKAYLGTGKTAANGYKKDFWEYDPVTNVWTQKANFGGTARYKATGFAIGTKGYIGTGYDLNGALVKSFWEYDPATNTWTQKAAFGGTARQNAVGFSIGSKGYIGTGITAANEYKKDFWEYDPATDTWTQKANAGNTVREAAVGFSIGSKGYIGTGNNSNGYKKDFWEYDPATDTWTQKAAFGGTARQGATGFSIDTKGYIATGYDGSYKNDFWEYDPSTNTWKQDVDFTGSVRAYAVGFSVSGKGYIGTGNNSSSTFNDFREYTAPVFVGLKVYADADGDGFGDPGNSIITSDCVVPSGYVTNGSDCDDANAAINPNGIPVKQWDVRFGGTLDDRLSKVQQTTDGGYIVGGRSKSGNSGDKTQANRDGTNATWDYWIVKTDAAGVKQWNKRFGGTKNDELVTLQQTLDGGYILGGHGYSGLNGDKSQANYDATEATADYWIVKTDASGIKQWDFRYGGSGDDQFQDLQLTTDGGYILGGYSSSGISGDKSQASQGDADYWIIKINSAGVKQWDARYGGTNADYLYDLEQTADGGYILGGRSYSGIGGDKTQANWDGSNTTFDYWIVKTDANGVKQWDKRFGGTGDDVLYALKQASGGGYILAGYSESGIGGDKTQATQGGTDYWMVKTDANGTKLWDTRFGGSSDEQLYVLERSSDDGYL
ncbi:MAG TPA: MopE-related protein, partial [Chitinophagales bacterium]|nr:MopE-related protein [Chitinophagales bacterium]